MDPAEGRPLPLAGERLACWRGPCRFSGPGIPSGRLRVSRSRGGLDALCSHVAMGSDPGEAGNSRVARLGCRESSRGNTKRLFRIRAGSIKDHLVCSCPGAQGLLLPRTCAGANWSSGPSSLSIYSGEMPRTRMLAGHFHVIGICDSVACSPGQEYLGILQVESSLQRSSVILD